jgi:hypothetical protein
VDYIHYNPVKHGWVSRVSDWPIRVFIGMYARDRSRSTGRAAGKAAKVSMLGNERVGFAHPTLASRVSGEPTLI